MNAVILCIFLFMRLVPDEAQQTDLTSNAALKQSAANSRDGIAGDSVHHGGTEVPDDQPEQQDNAEAAGDTVVPPHDDDDAQEHAMEHTGTDAPEYRRTRVQRDWGSGV